MTTTAEKHAGGLLNSFVSDPKKNWTRMVAAFEAAQRKAFEAGYAAGYGTDVAYLVREDFDDAYADWQKERENE